MTVRRSLGESSRGVTLGEVSRKVDELGAFAARRFDDIDRRMSTEVVPVDVYRAEARERDGKIDTVRRSLNRFYGFAAALAVAAVGAMISAAGALVIALIFATRHG